jgi:hypothetical protein
VRRGAFGAEGGGEPTKAGKGENGHVASWARFGGHRCSAEPSKYKVAQGPETVRSEKF